MFNWKSNNSNAIRYLSTVDGYVISNCKKKEFYIWNNQLEECIAGGKQAQAFFGRNQTSATASNEKWRLQFFVGSANCFALIRPFHSVVCYPIHINIVSHPNPMMPTRTTHHWRQCGNMGGKTRLEKLFCIPLLLLHFSHFLCEDANVNLVIWKQCLNVVWISVRHPIVNFVIECLLRFFGWISADFVDKLIVEQSILSVSWAII